MVLFLLVLLQHLLKINWPKDTRSASEEAVSGAVSNILNGINNQVNTKDDGMAPTGTVRVGYQFNIIMSSDVQIKPYLP